MGPHIQGVYLEPDPTKSTWGFQTTVRVEDPSGCASFIIDCSVPPGQISHRLGAKADSRGRPCYHAVKLRSVTPSGITLRTNPLRWQWLPWEFRERNSVKLAPLCPAIPNVSLIFTGLIHLHSLIFTGLTHLHRTQSYLPCRRYHSTLQDSRHSGARLLPRIRSSLRLSIPSHPSLVCLG